MKSLIGAAIGVAGMYLLDPQQGRTRRARLKDQATALVRRGAREVGRKADNARGQAEGLRHIGSSDVPPDNDQTLTAKVESEVLSRWDYPKGRINVNTVGGVVELRGTCETGEQINELEAAVRNVAGVVDVRNFLHLPGTPPPTTQAVRERS